MTMRSLFATQLYEADLAGESAWSALLPDLAAACRMLAAEDKAGRAWCRANAYTGYTSYASLNDLPIRDPAFGALKTLLDRHARAFAEAAHFDLNRRLKLDSLWVNVLKPSGAHSGHIHPHSILSGTLYVETPPGSSALKLEDPRLPLMMAAPTLTSQAPEDTRRFVYLTPHPGTLFLWESWLRHEVPANAAKSDRISISFNYS